MTHWHVLGAGCIGSWAAARLHVRGIAVTLLLRHEASLAGYHAGGGLTLAYTGAPPLRASPPAALAAQAIPHQVLVCTKTPDTLAALTTVFPESCATALVVLLQNGMGMAEQLAARWPRLRLYNAVTTAGVFRHDAWQFRCITDGETFVADPCVTPARATPTPQDAAAITQLAATGFWQLDARIDRRLWQKLAINAVINGLTGIHRCRNGELESIADAAALIPHLAAEIDAVAAAEGITLVPDALTSARAVMRSTAGNLSSMNRDLATGRRTEIDAINGFVVERAHAHSIPVPANKQVLAAVHALESRTTFGDK